MEAAHTTCSAHAVADGNMDRKWFVVEGVHPIEHTAEVRRTGSQEPSWLVVEDAVERREGQAGYVVAQEVRSVEDAR